MLETLKALCALNGVTGDEENVREYIKRRVEPFADSVTEDVLGNLIVFKRGAAAPKNKLLLAAHMDEVGVSCVAHTSDGYLKFACAGGIDRRVLLGKKVFFGDICGVIGFRAVHLMTQEERKSVPKVDDMYIDIGAKDKAEAESLVKTGDAGAFCGETLVMGDKLRAKAIDDRVGCAVLIKLIEAELPYDCTFLFSVQEEVGTRGATAAAYRIAPDIALVIEGTTAADLPSVGGFKKICAPGKGVVLPFMDGRTIYDKGLQKLLSGLADENGIRWQTKTYIAGGTDASVIQRSRMGVRTAGIAAAIRNIHSPNSIASISDIEDMLKLTKLALAKIGE